MGIGYRNREQYADPTPFFALRDAEKKEKKTHQTFSPALPPQEKEDKATPDEQLSIAIIFNAAEDYREARRVLRRFPENKEALKLLLDAEEFFRGSWIGMLTDVPGEKILARLAAECDEKDRQFREALDALRPPAPPEKKPLQGGIDAA